MDASTRDQLIAEMHADVRNLKEDVRDFKQTCGVIFDKINGPEGIRAKAERNARRIDNLRGSIVVLITIVTATFIAALTALLRALLK